MTPYDEVAEANSDDECRAWLQKLIEAKQDIISFVDRRLGGDGTGKFDCYYKGSFNASVCVKFDNGLPKALIRFPKPGHVIWHLEKVANEVRAIEYLSQNTTIPLPRVRLWGPAKESPHGLGPFIIMDFIEGTRLSTLLKQPTKDPKDDVILSQTLEDDMLDTIYDQLADYLLQISRLDLHRIGAISKDPSTDTWSVTGRPLTYNMNELVASAGYPIDRLSTESFDRASDFFKSVASEHLIHVQAQRNISRTPEDARERFIARHRFAELIGKYTVDDEGPFKLFCDDLQPSNILIDPETLRITGVLDLEFTNAMPAQFTYDPPWWLLLLGPEMWLEHYSKKEFLGRYVPRMEQFLRAMERVEAKTASANGRLEEPRLSSRMHDSWKTKRFWFNLAARKSLDVDSIYWEVLHEDDSDNKSFEKDMKVEMESFIQMKMEQLKAWRTEYDARFPETDADNEKT